MLTNRKAPDAQGAGAYSDVRGPLMHTPLVGFKVGVLLPNAHTPTLHYSLFDSLVLLVSVVLFSEVLFASVFLPSSLFPFSPFDVLLSPSPLRT